MKWNRHRTSSAERSGRHSRSAATNVRLDWSKLSATSWPRAAHPRQPAWRAAGSNVPTIASLDLGERWPDECFDHRLELQSCAAGFGQQPHTLARSACCSDVGILRRAIRSCCGSNSRRATSSHPPLRLSFAPTPRRNRVRRTIVPLPTNSCSRVSEAGGAGASDRAGALDIAVTVGIIQPDCTVVQSTPIIVPSKPNTPNMLNMLKNMEKPTMAQKTAHDFDQELLASVRRLRPRRARPPRLPG